MTRTGQNTSRFRVLLAAAAMVGLAVAMPAEAWKTKPKPEPKPTPTQEQGQGQGQTQGQDNDQGQSQDQQAFGGGGGKSKATSSAAAKSKAQVGDTTAAIDQSQSNSGNFSYAEANNPVQPAGMIILGCQVIGQAGGGNTRAAGMLGIGFTPEKCYDYMQAQAYHAIGDEQGACEILNHTPAAERARKRGAKLPECLPKPEPQVRIGPPEHYRPQPQLGISREEADRNYATKEELDRAFRRGVSK